MGRAELIDQPSRFRRRADRCGPRGCDDSAAFGGTFLAPVLVVSTLTTFAEPAVARSS
jgi:hypothetical protein